MLAESTKAEGFPCLHCGRPFAGRPNRLYCDKACSRAAEYDRKKLRELMRRLPILVRAEQEALNDGNYIEVAWCKGARQRVALEIDRRVDELLAKTPRHTSDDIRTQLSELVNKLSELTQGATRE